MEWQRVAAPANDQSNADELMNQLWLPVAGYEDLYEVSDLGNVRSLERRVRHPHAKSGYVIKPGVIRKPHIYKGYKQLVLSKEGKFKGTSVHMLVAKAFLPPCPGPIGIHAGQWTVDHIDNDKLNNAASNLQWLPCDANYRKDNTGEQHPQSKLTKAIAEAIQKDNRRQCDIAADYGVSQPTISAIKNGKHWSQCN